MALKLKERTYNRVPRNSTLEFSVLPVKGTGYSLNGRVDHGGKLKRSLKHAQLKGKTVNVKLDKKGTTIVRVSSAFSGASNSSVKVTAKVIKPDGKQFSRTWNATLTGKKDDVARAKIRCIVK